MTTRSYRLAVSSALLAVSLIPRPAAAQAAATPRAPRGSFVGSDSLDARMEPGSSSRGRHQLRGAATWTIERDTLDLRPKFTIRLELPAPSPATIVIRAVDSMPPAPGRYSFFIKGSGASHSRPGEVSASVYSREGRRKREYLPIGDTLVITSVTTDDGVPLVSGHLAMRSGRLEESKPALVRGYVWLEIMGDFTASPAREPRPVIAVTEDMQRAVLLKALTGFLITSSGAINSDGAADSTHSAPMGRAFLESRWSDALVVEHVEASDTSFSVRLRGRFVPIVCEYKPGRRYADCAKER